MSSLYKDHILSMGENKICYPGIFIEADGPGMFALKMLHGNRDGLKDRNAILLSGSVATALCGNFISGVINF
jgi:putative ABC transport system permease protein